MVDENKAEKDSSNNTDISDSIKSGNDSSNNTGIVNESLPDKDALADTDIDESADSSEEKEKPFYREILEVVVVAVVLAVILRVFIITPFYIPSESMLPTLEINDRILVSRVNYYFSEPKRGDVVVFVYPRDPNTVFVKRCVAVGGETVEGKNSVLYINGEAVAEDYLPDGERFGNFGPTQVPEGNYFMLGDNRNNSDDSRSWGFVSNDLLIGKAVVKIFPFDRAGVVR
ncbi:MAG: signal peptidase I [Peptococcaceae bacterium]|nr:signal peptidase I [Peptococcaceae bacterium]